MGPLEDGLAAEDLAQRHPDLVEGEAEVGQGVGGDAVAEGPGHVVAGVLAQQVDGAGPEGGEGGREPALGGIRVPAGDGVGRRGGPSGVELGLHLGLDLRQPALGLAQGPAGLLGVELRRRAGGPARHHELGVAGEAHPGQDLPLGQLGVLQAAAGLAHADAALAALPGREDLGVGGLEGLDVGRVEGRGTAGLGDGPAGRGHLAVGPGQPGGGQLGHLGRGGGGDGRRGRSGGGGGLGHQVADPLPLDGDARGLDHGDATVGLGGGESLGDLVGALAR